MVGYYLTVFIFQLMSCGLLETLKFSVLELQEHLDTYNVKREAAEQVSVFCISNQIYEAFPIERKWSLGKLNIHLTECITDASSLPGSGSGHTDKFEWCETEPEFNLWYLGRGQVFLFLCCTEFIKKWCPLPCSLLTVDLVTRIAIHFLVETRFPQNQGWSTPRCTAGKLFLGWKPVFLQKRCWISCPAV